MLVDIRYFPSLVGLCHEGSRLGTHPIGVLDSEFFHPPWSRLNLACDLRLPGLQCSCQLLKLIIVSVDVNVDLAKRRVVLDGRSSRTGESTLLETGNAISCMDESDETIEEVSYRDGDYMDDDSLLRR